MIYELWKITKKKYNLDHGSKQWWVLNCVLRCGRFSFCGSHTFLFASTVHLKAIIALCPSASRPPSSQPFALHHSTRRSSHATCQPPLTILLYNIPRKLVIFNSAGKETWWENTLSIKVMSFLSTSFKAPISSTAPRSPFMLKIA